MLLVAPYNVQVRALRAANAGVAAGSVDKFQGQEAPVVIVSMCASSGDCIPRGIEYLLNPKRLNVALSRAEGLAIAGASPKLARTRVASVAQMKRVNLFCRIVLESARRTYERAPARRRGALATRASIVKFLNIGLARLRRTGQ